MAAYDSQVIDRIMPKLKQWEATTGRRITPAMLESMMRAELGVEADRAQENAYRAKGLQLEEQKIKDAKSAAKASSLVQIPTTAANLWLTNKALNRPSETAELIKAMKGTGTATPTTAATAPAIDLGSVPALTKPGALVAPGTNLGGQTLLAGGGGGAVEVGGQAALATGTTEAGTMAAYDASVAAGAAEGVGSTAGTTAGTGILETVSSFAGPAALVLAGRPVGKMISKALGTHEKTTTDIVETAGYAGAGFLVAGPVGAVVGGVMGAVKGIADTVICTELSRQGKLSERDRTKCVLFRFHHINNDMFCAYLEWATPIVAVMKRGGVLNAMLLPFAKAFVGYMIAIQDKRYPSFVERTVWNWAWWRCSRIAHKHGAMIAQEVA